MRRLSAAALAATAALIAISHTTTAQAQELNQTDWMKPGYFAGFDIARVAATGSCEDIARAAEAHNLRTEADARWAVRDYDSSNLYNNPFGPHIPNPLERIMIAHTENQWVGRAVSCGAVTPDIFSIGITLGGALASS